MGLKNRKSKNDDLDIRSWRSISQIAGREAVTTIARNRRLLSRAKLSGICLTFLLTLTALCYGFYSLAIHRERFNLAGPSDEVRQIVFQSDGVLTHEWIQRIVRIPVSTEMMDVDIFAIKGMLEDFGQIRIATVSRRFPDELLIGIREREPILRARVPAYSESFEELLISQDGFVYKGRNYPEESLSRIPYLDGVSFKRSREGFQPISGMETVGKLLTLASTRFPSIYESWRVVSCEKFTGRPDISDQLITVRGKNIRETVFSTDDFETQLIRLAQVIDHSRRREVNALKRVNLSLGEQVFVQYYPKLMPR